MAADTPTRSQSKKPRRRRKSDDADERTTRRKNGGAPEAEQDADDATDEQFEDDRDDGGDEQGGGSQGGIGSELKDTIREAALEVLKPVARKATTEAAKFAATKGPDIVKDNLMPKLSEAGGVGGIAELAKTAGGGLIDKVKPGGGDDDDDESSEDLEGTGKGRRLPVQEHVDVGVPIDTAYNQWTQFEEFPKFMHRVEKLEQRDDTHLMWHENIWGVRRQWEAEITSQRPNERIAWKSLSGTTQVGVVTFHAIGDTLTRVQVNLDFQPHGLKEKMASGMRMSRRALKSDLMRFKAFIEMRDEETGEWRGEIDDGDVVDEQERDDRDERDDDREPEAREDDERYDEEDDEYEDEEDEPRAESDDDYVDEDEEDDEDEARAELDDDEDDEPRSKPKAKSKAKSTKSKAKPKSKAKSKSDDDDEDDDDPRAESDEDEEDEEREKKPRRSRRRGAEQSRTKRRQRQRA